MNARPLFLNNLKKNYRVMLCCSGLLLLIYNFLSLEIVSVYNIKILKVSFPIEKEFWFTFFIVIYEIMLMIGIVMINLLSNEKPRRIAWHFLYISGFGILLLFFKVSFIDLAFYYFTLVWVESHIYKDYMAIEF